jgi:hypothetical protein
MSESALRVGERVRLINVPEWLVHDLPIEDRNSIEKHLGCVFELTEVDANGYIWMGFATTNEDDAQNGIYRGQTFCVTPDCVVKVDS